MTAMRGTPSKLVMRTPAAVASPSCSWPHSALNEGGRLARAGLIGARAAVRRDHAATRWRGLKSPRRRGSAHCPRADQSIRLGLSTTRPGES